MKVRPPSQSQRDGRGVNGGSKNEKGRCGAHRSGKVVCIRDLFESSLRDRDRDTCTHAPQGSRAHRDTARPTGERGLSTAFQTIPKRKYIIMLSAIAAATYSFTPMQPIVSPPTMGVRAPVVTMSMSSRRAAVLGLATAASSFAVPALADSIEDIAARNAAAAAKEREAKAAAADGTHRPLFTLVLATEHGQHDRLAFASLCSTNSITYSWYMTDKCAAAFLVVGSGDGGNFARPSRRRHRGRRHAVVDGILQCVSLGSRLPMRATRCNPCAPASVC